MKIQTDLLNAIKVTVMKNKKYTLTRINPNNLVSIPLKTLIIKKVAISITLIK